MTRKFKSLNLWIAVSGGFALWMGALVVWLSSVAAMNLRTQLISVVPLFLWAGFCLLVLAFLLSAREIGQIMASFGRQTLIAVGVVVFLAFSLVHWAAPRTHRLFYDEDIYESIGLNMAHTNQAAMVNDGRWEFGRFRAFRQEYNKQPNGWPFIISIAYRLFGVSESTIFNLSNTLFAAACLLVFLCGTFLFGDSLSGLFAALIYALIPENALWFSTLAVEPATAFFSLLGMTSVLLYFRNRTRPLLLLIVCSWALAVQFRPETLLLLGVVLLMFYVDGWEEMKKPGLYGFGILFLVLVSAHIGHLYSVRDNSWGSSGTKLAVSFIGKNLKTNTIYYWDNLRFPVVISLLAFLGLLAPGQRKARLYAGSWFLAAWAIFIFFYAGSYQYGADVRFSLMSMAPLALFAGRGSGRIIAWMETRWGRALPVNLLVLVLGVTLVVFLPFIRELTQEAWECRDDHKAAEEFAALTPNDGIILTHNPNMFQIFGKNAAQMSLFMEDPNYVAQTLRPQFGKNIYVHWNYWCNINVPTQKRFVEFILANYETTIVQEKIVRGKKYALYQVGQPRLGDRLRSK